MIAAAGAFLLRDLIYHPVLGLVSHFPSRPPSFERLFQVLALCLAANCGALPHTVRCESLGFIAWLFPFALCTRVFASALASRLADTGTEPADASYYGK